VHAGTSIPQKKIYLWLIFLLGELAKLRKATRFLFHVSLTVRPHGTQVPLDGISLNLKFVYFSKICRQN